MYKYSILQYNFNNYDNFIEPYEVDPDCEYILVTDNEKLKSNKVKIIIDNELNKLPTWEKCYKVRFNLFKYCSTDICIYLDSNVILLNSLNDIYNVFSKNEYDLGVLIHNERKNIIQEYWAWVNIRNYPKERAIYILNYLKNKNYNILSNGLYEGKMRICKNTKLNKEIDSMCLKLLKDLSYNNDYERIDQTLYSCILNTYFTKLNVMPISPRIFTFNYMQVTCHKTNIKINYNCFNTGYIFDKPILI